MPKFYETLKSISTIGIHVWIRRWKMEKKLYISEDDEQPTMTRYFFSARITIEIINE